MIIRTLIAVCFIWITMSQTAIKEFSKITQAEIKFGVIDLHKDGDNMIYAVGNKNGQSWWITCRWVGGQPAWIMFSHPKPEI
jgi:hypothetical protein